MNETLYTQEKVDAIVADLRKAGPCGKPGHLTLHLVPQIYMTNLLKPKCSLCAEIEAAEESGFNKGVLAKGNTNMISREQIEEQRKFPESGIVSKGQLIEYINALHLQLIQAASADFKLRQRIVAALGEIKEADQSDARAAVLKDLIDEAKFHKTIWFSQVVNWLESKRRLFDPATAGEGQTTENKPLNPSARGR